MVALAIIAFLGALVLGFLGGRDSMTSEIRRKEEALHEAHVKIDTIRMEREELQRLVQYLNKRLLEETDGKILDIPDDENGEEI